MSIGTHQLHSTNLYLLFIQLLIIKTNLVFSHVEHMSDAFVNQPKPQEKHHNVISPRLGTSPRDALMQSQAG